MKSTKKSVIIVEDNPGLREQLQQILESVDDIKCIGAYVSAEKALPKILENNPDVVLMDIKLPGMSGIDCVVQIKKSAPDIQVIMVTVYEDSENIFLALLAGASGYLIKSSPAEQLIEAIRNVHTGGAPMSSPIARQVVKYFHLLGPSVRESEDLSPKEREVLNLLSMGLIYKEIGGKLNITVETVRTHVKHICKKMHVRTKVEAIAKHGLNPAK
jgi:DNA-binding NarL/FixJ family response regulator